jgi:hypothetical protein
MRLKNRAPGGPSIEHVSDTQSAVRGNGPPLWPFNLARWQSTALVFTNPAGGPPEPITLHGNFKRVLAKAAINPLSGGIPRRACFWLRASVSES